MDEAMWTAALAKLLASLTNSDKRTNVITLRLAQDGTHVDAYCVVRQTYAESVYADDVKAY